MAAEINGAFLKDNDFSLIGEMTSQLEHREVLEQLTCVKEIKEEKAGETGQTTKQQTSCEPLHLLLEEFWKRAARTEAIHRVQDRWIRPEDAPDNMAVIMDCGDLEVLYGAASEEGYGKLMEVMEGIGEPL